MHSFLVFTLQADDRQLYVRLRLSDSQAVDSRAASCEAFPVVPIFSCRLRSSLPVGPSKPPFVDSAVDFVVRSIYCDTENEKNDM